MRAIARQGVRIGAPTMAGILYTFLFESGCR